MARSTESAVHYLHPEGWSEQPDGALGRIRSRVSTRRHVVRECVVEEPDGKGGWRERTDPAASRITDGWQWFAWRIMRAGSPLVMFRGVRPLDADMAVSLCDGLALHTPSGSILESPDDAGLIFALAPADAQRFRERVIGAGGAVVGVAPDAGRAGAAATELARAAAQAAALAQQAMELIHGGNAAGRTTAAQMDEILGAAWECRARGRTALDSIERSGGGIQDVGESTEEATALAAVAIAAHSDWQRIDDALSEIIGAQREAALQIATSEAGPAAPHLAAPFDQWHGHIAARLRAQGQDARVEEGELIIDLPGGRLRIGQTARLEPHGG